jgi:gliding motility-associated lipoprotein GldD
MKIFKLLTLLFVFVFVSCNNDFQPKPRGFFRIELPEKSYQVFGLKEYPYQFEISKYAKPMLPGRNAEKYWINIYYPKFNAQLHLSYKRIDNNLDTLLNDVHSMVNKHIPKATAINEQMYVNESNSVFGMAYEIKGSQAASAYQFYMTDSTQHFLRGALYFNFSPNNDSLKPVIEYLEGDIQHLIETLSWAENIQE